MRSKPTSCCGPLVWLALVLLCCAAAQAHAQSSKKPSSARSSKPDPQVAEASTGATSSSASPDCLADPECRKIFESARRLSDSGQYNAALTGYEKAYALRPSPWLLINIGRVQQKMGRPADAVTSFQRFLSTADNGPKEVVDAAREYLQQAESDLAAQRAKEQRRLQPAGQGDPAAATALSESKPVYKKWWFWLALAGGAAAVAAVAVGVTVGTAGPSEPARAPFHIAF